LKSLDLERKVENVTREEEEVVKRGVEIPADAVID
jgi:hypothetical protein